jgi:hypothetical protein
MPAASTMVLLYAIKRVLLYEWQIFLSFLRIIKLIDLIKQINFLNFNKIISS